MEPDQPAAVPGPVLVVGVGLLGTSIGLALSRAGVEVWLQDVDDRHLRTASGLGAGRVAPDAVRPALVVVAVPPGRVGPVVAQALQDHPDAVVTDVGSVKQEPLSHVPESGRSRYVGGHPMAGSERSGPLAASPSLFDGRPWAITPTSEADPAAIAAVSALATTCGAAPVVMDPADHDLAVARTSHVPHLAASLVAARLAEAPGEYVALSGQGVRDVTRVAAGDPELYGQIVSLNAEAVLDVLTEVRDDLEGLVRALTEGRGPDLAGVLARGVAGTRAIPGKHGGVAEPTRTVFVSVPDHPGELARLFADAGDSGVNIEDVRIDHDPARPVGQVELLVAEDRAEQLLVALEARGWTTHR